MHVKNLTPFPFATKITSLRPPQLKMVLALRGKFRLTPGEVTLPEGIPALAQGAMRGDTFDEDDDERTGELRWSDDFADAKLHAEVLFYGSCHTPGGQAMPECPVELRVGDWRKALRVVGDRVWKGGMLGKRAGPCEPFTRMPLDYARAFGGPGFGANPVGRGIAGETLPNVESPAAPIGGPRDRPEPASFAPRSPMWAARQAMMGRNYGKRYRLDRAPYFADDFDWRYFNAAPRDQQLRGYLRGDERLGLQNLIEGAALLETRLPGLRVRCFVHGGGRLREVQMNLDTLTIVGDEGSVYLTWRGHDDVDDPDLDDVQTIVVASEPLAEPPLPAEHYYAELRVFEADPLELDERIGKARAEAFRMQREAEQADDDDARVDAALAVLKAEANAEALAQIEGMDPEEKSLRTRIAEHIAMRQEQETPTPVPLPEAPRIFVRHELERVLKEIRAARGKLPADGDARALDDAEAKLADPKLLALDPTYRPPGSPPPSEDKPGPHADLSQRDFTGQSLAGRDLRGANLEGAVLIRADLRGADLRGARLAGAMLFRADLEGAVLAGADLSRSHFGKANLRGADLGETLLDEAFFGEADLTEARLCGARGADVLLTRALLSGVNAAGITLVRARLEEAVLEGIDLTEATLERCLLAQVRAAGARFCRAQIEGATFMRGELSGADFSWCQASGANFNESDLEGADFSAAILRDAYLMRIKAQGARFIGAVLTGARLTKAQLADADFTGAKLLRTELVRASIDRTCFRDCNLFGAAFNEARGSGPDFTGADLSRSTLDL